MMENVSRLTQLGLMQPGRTLSRQPLSLQCPQVNWNTAAWNHTWSISAPWPWPKSSTRNPTSSCRPTPAGQSWSLQAKHLPPVLLRSSWQTQHVGHMQRKACWKAMRICCRWSECLLHCKGSWVHAALSAGRTHRVPHRTWHASPLSHTQWPPVEAIMRLQTSRAKSPEPNPLQSWLHAKSQLQGFGKPTGTPFAWKLASPKASRSAGTRTGLACSCGFLACMPLPGWPPSTSRPGGTHGPLNLTATGNLPMPKLQELSTWTSKLQVQIPGTAKGPCMASRSHLGLRLHPCASYTSRAAKWNGLWRHGSLW